jgi:hypothetical protein
MSAKLDNLERLKLVVRMLNEYEQERGVLIKKVYGRGDTVTWARANSAVQVGVVLDTGCTRVKVRNTRTGKEMWLVFEWLLKGAR